MVFHIPSVESCTDILVTPGASTDASAMIAYNADSPTLYGFLYHYPATSRNDNRRHHHHHIDEDVNPTWNSTRRIYSWDTGAFLGEIPEVNGTTYNVVGNANERGLIIGETTFGGVPILASGQADGILDYGSLIYITLQRAKSVQEAIDVMVDLLDAYGYASSGESLSLADASGSVWMMEMIGRGDAYGKRGVVWVAQRIPDGAVAAHANHARITTFARDDPENVRYAPDVVDVAAFYNLFDATTNDPLTFSFSDVYDPADFSGVRHGEARIWSIFSKIADDTGNFQSQYESYALGESLTHRMPLYVFPYRKISVLDVMELMASHYEGTRLDSSIDVGAGLFESPYRPRPLEWSFRDQSYHNERSVATAKTGWNFVGQIRPQMPPELAALLWFAADDSSTSPRTPVYASATRISPAFAGMGPQDGVPSPILRFDLTKAFWVQNMVSNFCYYRYKDVYPILRKKLYNLQNDLLKKVALVDERALTLYNQGLVEDAIQYLTLFGVNAGDALHKYWMEFYGELFVRFRDFYTIDADPKEPSCGCIANEPGLSDAMKKRIIDETGDHYKVIEHENVIPVVHGESL